jgi:hypothetical protein
MPPERDPRDSDYARCVRQQREANEAKENQRPVPSRHPIGLKGGELAMLDRRLSVPTHPHGRYANGRHSQAGDLGRV